MFQRYVINAECFVVLRWFPSVFLGDMDQRTDATSTFFTEGTPTASTFTILVLVGLMGPGIPLI